MERCPFCKRPLHGLSALLQPYHETPEEKLREILNKRWEKGRRILRIFKKWFPLRRFKDERKNCYN